MILWADGLTLPGTYSIPATTACAGTSDIKACAVAVRLAQVQVRRITSTILFLLYRFFSPGVQVHVSLT